MYAAPVQELIDQLGRLPGVGPKSAQRIAFYLLKLPKEDAERLAHAIVEVAPGHDLPEPAELAAFLAPRLSRHKLPYTCELVTAPLRDEAGKVRRTRLREERLEAPRASYLRLR